MTEVQTKQCPFCAETIQAAAIVCRYCGRDLVDQTPARPNTRDEDRQYIESRVAEWTKAGWQVVSQTDTSAQFRKPKEWSKVGVLLFVFLPGLGACLWWPLIGVSILGLLLVVADYLMKKEEIQFISADAARAQQAQQAQQQPAIAAEHPRLIVKESGRSACSNCNGTLKPDAIECHYCGAQFAKA